MLAGRWRAECDPGVGGGGRGPGGGEREKSVHRLVSTHRRRTQQRTAQGSRYHEGEHAERWIL